MENDNSNILRNVLDTEFTLFDLRIKASQIQNNYDVQKSISKLMDFIEMRNLRFTNP